jgi:4-oxalocrotonate tautomerase
MPHIVITVARGKTNEQKQQLADAIAQDVVRIFDTTDASVSIALEEVDREHWAEQVYWPLIAGKWETLIKKPGYDPFAK